MEPAGELLMGHRLRVCTRRSPRSQDLSLHALPGFHDSHSICVLIQVGREAEFIPSPLAFWWEREVSS